MPSDELAGSADAGTARRGANARVTTRNALPLAETAAEIGAAEAKPRRGANGKLAAGSTVPPATVEVGGHASGGGLEWPAPDPIPMASGVLTTARQMPSEAGAAALATLSETGGRRWSADHGALAPAGEALTGLATACDELRALQRQRQFCIVSQSRCDRSCESFIARIIGFDVNADEKARKAVFKRASDLRKAVEKGQGGEGLADPGDRELRALSACTPIIVSSAAARAGWDTLRLNTEKRMRQLARSLPVHGWVQTVPGLGDLGLGILIGETGDLAGYATKERVWKRLGLAVIGGVRQSRRTNAEEAAAHGFSPKRRAEVWTIADSLFRAQWRGAREGVPARPIGAYGEVYAARKAHTADREDWTPGHCDNDARRIMAKFMIENLWRVWNGKPALEPSRIGEPREDAA
jgi:hypothetical protein